MKTLLISLLIAAGGSLVGCASSPPPYPVSEAPHTPEAPATHNGKVTPSYGGNYNPVSGQLNNE
jgi:hypothetical protein